MTIRAPLYTRYVPRQQSVDLLTWIDGVVPGAPPTPRIQNQEDWPNPQLRIANLELRSWINQLPPGIVSLPVPPLRNYDWQNPLPKAPNLELRSWVWTAFPGSVPATPIQNRQNDWPNPQPLRANLELRSWSNQLPPGIVSNPVPPILNYDWPNPGISASRVNLTWIWSQQIQPAVVGAPFAQYDWPNPQGRLLQQIDYLQNLLTTTLAPPVVVNPFVQTDWPNPKGFWPSIDLSTWLQTPQAGNIPPAPSVPAISIDPWPVHWPMPPVSQAQLKKYIQQQRRAANRRARQIAAQVRYDEELKSDLARALKREIPIEKVAERVIAKPLRKDEVDWNEVKAIVSALLEKPLKAVQTIQAQQVMEADPEEEEISELNELHSLYAQDFYERLEALQRLMRKKLN